MNKGSFGSILAAVVHRYLSEMSRPTCCKHRLAPWALKVTEMLCLAPTGSTAVEGCRLKAPRARAPESGASPFLPAALGVA